MYKAKERGRNTYEFYNEDMSQQAFKRVSLETDIRQAIEKSDFEAYYQPKINALTGKVIGMEALIRWFHKTHGMIPPDEFIPLAEEIGLISKIDQWMMEETLKRVLAWQKEGLSTGQLSLNVSMRQLEDKGFVEHIEEIIRKTGFDPQFLELEITESQIMKNPRSTINILKNIKALGVTISIDDFGTGYSSLSYLKRLPIDKLKIDKSFVQDISNNEDDTAIVKTIIVLAQSLKLKLIAEGVETLEQKDFLIKAGCPNMQGYYYSKPLCADEYRQFLIEHS
jgi:EAL domain-containing protein (putative c-di-GMP-specific phosphodiesterase class I)